jgi:hypothetical protein
MAVNRSIKKVLPAGVSILCLFILILSSKAAYAGVASISALSGAVYSKHKGAEPLDAFEEVLKNYPGDGY